MRYTWHEKKTGLTLQYFTGFLYLTIFIITHQLKMQGHLVKVLNADLHTAKGQATLVVSTQQ